MSVEPFTDMLHKTVNRNLLKYAAGRAIFCPGCSAIMDWKRTVIVEFPKGQTVVRCCKCWDETLKVILKDVPLSKWNETQAKLEIIDGRQFNARKAKVKA